MKTLSTIVVCFFVLSIAMAAGYAMFAIWSPVARGSFYSGGLKNGTPSDECPYLAHCW